MLEELPKSVLSDYQGEVEDCVQVGRSIEVRDVGKFEREG